MRSKRVQAVVDIMQECKRPSTSQAGAKRLLKACKALGFTVEETREVFCIADYCDLTGQPYSSAVTRIWE